MRSRGNQAILSIVPECTAAMLLVAVAVFAAPATTRGDDLLVNVKGVIGEYTTSGATVNPTLVKSPLGTALGDMAVSGSNLFAVGSNAV